MKYLLSVSDMQNIIVSHRHIRQQHTKCLEGQNPLYLQNPTYQLSQVINMATCQSQNPSPLPESNSWYYRLFILLWTLEQ